MTSSEPSIPATPTAFVAIGTTRYAIEADRIHVIGSGDRAHVRIVHGSVGAAHLTLCAHQGRLIVEDLGSPGGTWLDGQQLTGERDVPDGATLRIGEIPIAVGLDLAADHRSTVAGAAPIARRGEPDFAALMADELRRAPWFGLSILLHGLLFLVLYLILPSTPRIEHSIARFTLTEDDSQGVDVTENDVDPSEPQFEVADIPDPLESLPDVPIESVQPNPAAEAETSEAAPSFLDGVAAPGASLFTRIGGRGEGDILGGAGGGTSAGFRKTIAGLRESGLEIMFVLDSTGSMGPVLEATKRRMARMVEALHVLVPDARVGIVTYRDVGQNEDYLTRSIPLDHDLYRSLNFMQTVSSGGGGDRPEAVLEGLRVAVEQDWRKGARRVVVVIGDAPAHQQAANDLERMLRQFVKGGSSFVHAIMTSTDLFGSVAGDTRESFERIARVGNGLCVSNEREDKILEEVLSLAIGNEFRETLAAVFHNVESRETKATTRVRDMVRRADPGGIEREFRRSVVDDDFVRLLATSRSREVAELLIRLLRMQDLPAAGRHAIAHVLQQMLGLREPPVDPANPRPIDERTLRELRTTAASMLR